MVTICYRARVVFVVCQMIPVMLFGVLFAKKKYGLRDYFCVALITAGIVTFNLNGNTHNKKVTKEKNRVPFWCQYRVYHFGANVDCTILMSISSVPFWCQYRVYHFGATRQGEGRYIGS